MKSKFDKVLVLGIDGMEPKVVEKLMKEGRLPNFKKLSGNGSFMKLQTSNPPHSPVAWTSIATGCNPGKHNIFDFIRRNPENYMPELTLSKSSMGISGTNYSSYVQAEPFWRTLSEQNIPVSLIRWPVTFPAEKINGNMLSGLGVPDVKGFLSGYTYYTEKNLSEKDDKRKNLVVKKENNQINSFIFGPKSMKSREIVDIQTEIKIIVNQKYADIIVNEKHYEILPNKWSEWINVKFKAGLLKKVSGIFKAYLVNLEPFEMYITTVQPDPNNSLYKISSPENYSKKLAEEIGTFYTLGMPEETDGFVDGKISEKAFLEQVEDIEFERNKMFWQEFKEFQKLKKGVLGFVFDSSDRLQHTFWKEINLGKKEFSVDKVISDYYQKKDKLVGEILEKIDDNTLLLIISDHGFSSYEKSISINTWLVENGFMNLNRDLAEGEEGALFQTVNWENTKAFSVGFNSIYINLIGREGKGIVQDKKVVIDEIISKLSQLKDKEIGKKVINKIYKSSDIYDGKYKGNAPDLIIGFNPGYRMSWQNAIGGFTKKVITNNERKWCGDHLVDPIFVPGVLFSNTKFNKKTASQIDIAPTILKTIGMKTSEQFDGTSLFE